jgi:hypothetical protein
MTSHKAFRKLAVSALIMTLPLGSAFAQDVTAVAERLKVLSAHQGMELSWSNITGDPSSMVLEGVTVKPTGGAEPMAIGNVTLTDISEQNGGYRIETASTAPFSMDEDGVVIEASPLVFEGVTLPAENAGDPMSSLTFYESASLASLVVKNAGKTAFSLQNAIGRISPYAAGQQMDFTGSVEKFTTDLSLIQDPRVQGYVAALGYGVLEGDIRMQGSWTPTDGRWSMPQYDIRVNDVGTLGMTLDLGGLTPEFMDAANELSAQAAASDGENPAHDAKMMEMLKSLTFHGGTLRFNDDSLTGRTLDLIASFQGQKPEDVVNMAKMTIPLALAQMQMAQLAGAIVPAVSAYLDDPKSLEIVASPPAPVTFSEIHDASMATPSDSAATANALWSLLGVTVTANK